jgi:hypothetical protein
MRDGDFRVRGKEISRVEGEPLASTSVILLLMAVFLRWRRRARGKRRDLIAGFNAASAAVS